MCNAYAHFTCIYFFVYVWFCLKNIRQIESFPLHMRQKKRAHTRRGEKNLLNEGRQQKQCQAFASTAAINANINVIYAMTQQQQHQQHSQQQKQMMALNKKHHQQTIK